MAIVKIENNRYTVDSLYQWDVNQKLVIRGLSLASIPEIHFSNTDMGRAIVKQSSVDEAGIITVDIPNSLLQKPYRINAYICIYEDDTFKSLYCIEIPVKARTKPSDYNIENDEEIYSFNALETLVNNTIYNLTKANEELVVEVNNITEDAIKRVNGINADIVNQINADNEELQAELTTQCDEALAIAKGKITAKVFDNFEDMEAWLSNANNKAQLQVGDNLFIKALDVPDYWISAVLTKADASTGYYYNIAPLESQSSAPNIFYNGKVEGDNVAEALDNAQGSIDEVNEFVGMTKYNLLPYPYYNLTVAPNGITWTDNNGIITANGKATSDSWVQCAKITIPLKGGVKYKVKGCPKGGSNSKYWLVVYYTDKSIGADRHLFEYGDGLEFTLDQDRIVSLDLVIKSGYTANNLVFKPMIYDASIEIDDDTYKPYVNDVQTQIDNLKSQLGNAVCIDLEDYSYLAEPWKVLKSQIANLPYNRVVFGTINTGTRACYIGYKISDNSHGSFMVMQYQALFHVGLSAGKWYVKTVTDTGTQF